MRRDKDLNAETLASANWLPEDFDFASVEKV